MRGLQTAMQRYVYGSVTGSLKGLRRGSIIAALIVALAVLSPQGWSGGGTAYCDDTAGGGAGDSGGGTGDEGGGDEGDGGADEGDAGGDDAADDEGADDAGADDAGADDEAADDEAADEEPADDEPADDEPEDEADEADEEDDNEGDNEDEVEDDADDDDDSEAVRDGSESPLASIRRFSLDGMRGASRVSRGPAVAAEWKRNHGSMKRLGSLEDFIPLHDREKHLLSKWDDPLAPTLHESVVTVKDNKEIPDLKLPPAGLPKYRAGDTYVYSDGTWERVVASDSYGVRWVNHRGNISSGSLDFTYKRTNWQTSSRKGSRTFQQTKYLFGKSTTTLWPLAAGNTTRFDEFGSWSNADGVKRFYDSFWRCEVEGTERIRVAAGEFDSWRITCARYSDSYSYPKAKPREYKTWYYAPTIGHWVVESRDNRGYRPNRRKELTAVMPDLLLLTGDDKGVIQLQEQFQDVLENYKSGQSDLWMERSGATSSTIIPLATYMREDGVYCRQYVQYIQSENYSGTYGGIGCRGVDGLWRILRR